jgi:hypothetical protein
LPLHETSFERRTLQVEAFAPVVKLIESDDPNAFEHCAVSITGFEKCKQGSGSVVSADENGTYIRLSPENDIDGNPHYFKNDRNEHARRHLYFSKVALGASFNKWVIAKTCNADVMGSQAYSVTDKIDGKYSYFPPNTAETMKITILTAQNAVALLTEAKAKAGSYSFDEGTSAEVAAELDSAGLGVQLTKWRDSNHECMVFNNQTGTVSFLSLKHEQLRSNMHPVLFKHLSSNNITVGEDLTIITEDHWKILAALTGVHRTREEAAIVSRHA